MKFKCKECNKEEDVLRFTSRTAGYFIKDKEIMCCEKPMTPVFPEGEFGAVVLGFDSLPSSEKKKILKVRAKKHHDKYVAEKRRTMDLEHVDPNKKGARRQIKLKKKK
jgi:hypothetical protein